MTRTAGTYRAHDGLTSTAAPDAAPVNNPQPTAPRRDRPSPHSSARPHWASSISGRKTASESTSAEFATTNGSNAATAAATRGAVQTAPGGSVTPGNARVT